MNTDEWQKAINDNKFIINKKISKMFPYMQNPQQYLKLKIDQESHNFITHRDVANIITKIICTYLVRQNINPYTQTIVDFTAGVGGNVLSFAKYFKNVIAIEICKERAEFLQNNINVYELENCKVINANALNYNIDKSNDIIFIDPPWGGIGYREQEKLMLGLGEMPIESIITSIFANNGHIKIIALKLPKNYDVAMFNKNTKNIESTFWILKKMFLVICTPTPII